MVAFDLGNGLACITLGQRKVVLALCRLVITKFQMNQTAKVVKAALFVFGIFLFLAKFQALIGFDQSPIEMVNPFRPGRYETPGTLAIMAIYLGFFFVAWLLAFLYLATRWAIG